MTEPTIEGAKTQAIDHLLIVDVDTREVLVNQRGQAARAEVSSDQEEDGSKRTR